MLDSENNRSSRTKALTVKKRTVYDKKVLVLSECELQKPDHVRKSTWAENV